MPKPRPSRPPAPPPPPADLVRYIRESRELVRWKTAVHKEAWRLVYADGGNACGTEEFERARQSLIDRGHAPPPDLDRPRRPAPSPPPQG